MRFLFLLLALLTLHSSVQAGIFDSLFGSGEKKSDVVVEESEELPPQTEDGIIHEEKVIVEEEVISADEYMDSSEESDEKIFSEESAPQNQPAYEEESAVSDEDIIPEVSFSEEEEDPFIKVKNILLSYVDKPEKIYLLQHFPVKI